MFNESLIEKAETENEEKVGWRGGHGVSNSMGEANGFAALPGYIPNPALPTNGETRSSLELLQQGHARIEIVCWHNGRVTAVSGTHSVESDSILSAVTALAEKCATPAFIPQNGIGMHPFIEQAPGGVLTDPNEATRHSEAEALLDAAEQELITRSGRTPRPIEDFLFDPLLALITAVRGPLEYAYAARTPSDAFIATMVQQYGHDTVATIVEHISSEGFVAIIQRLADSKSPLVSGEGQKYLHEVMASAQRMGNGS